MYNYLKNCIHEATKEALGEKEVYKRRKTIFWDTEIEKERQNKKQLFLKWLSTKDYNDKVQYRKAQAKVMCCMFCRMRLCRILQSMQHTQGDTKERELLKCVVAVKECIRGGGRNLQDVIFKH